MLCFPCEMLSVQAEAGISNKMNLFFLPGNISGLPSNLVSYCQQCWEMIYSTVLVSFSFFLSTWVAQDVFKYTAWSDFFNEMMAGLFSSPWSLCQENAIPAVQRAVLWFLFPYFLNALLGQTKSFQKLLWECLGKCVLGFCLPNVCH